MLSDSFAAPLARALGAFPGGVARAPSCPRRGPRPPTPADRPTFRRPRRPADDRSRARVPPLASPPSSPAFPFDDARSTTLEVGDFAKLDLGRAARTGLPEVVWGPGKTPAQILAIMEALRDKQPVVLATRVDPATGDLISAANPDVRYDPVARICLLDGTPDAPRADPIPGRLLVLTAGTADLAVAREAAVVAEAAGVRDVRVVADVGVAGLHRLLSRVDEIRSADVVLVVAGMDGALPSVVAGLVDAPVVAVPTSVGYGVAAGGLSPLAAALNSCASGVVVVNIDNGFGGAVAAVKMLRAAGKLAGRIQKREGG